MRAIEAAKAEIHQKAVLQAARREEAKKASLAKSAEQGRRGLLDQFLRSYVYTHILLCRHIFNESQT